MTNETSPMHKQTGMLMTQIFALVRACPVGKVTTYGWLAKAVGYPRGARMVGWIMHEASAGVPAQRVVNSKGELSGSWAFGTPDRMRLLLEGEGIEFDADGKIDLKLYGWDPMRDLSEAEREQILNDTNDTTEQPSARLVGLMQYDAASPLKGTQQG